MERASTQCDVVFRLGEQRISNGTPVMTKREKPSCKAEGFCGPRRESSHLSPGSKFMDLNRTFGANIASQPHPSSHILAGNCAEDMSPLPPRIPPPQPPFKKLNLLHNCPSAPVPQTMSAQIDEQAVNFIIDQLRSASGEDFTIPEIEASEAPFALISHVRNFINENSPRDKDFLLEKLRKYENWLRLSRFSEQTSLSGGRGLMESDLTRRGELLGSGAFGEVCRYKTKEGDQVVVKTIKSTASPGHKQNFYLELEVSEAIRKKAKETISSPKKDGSSEDPLYSEYQGFGAMALSEPVKDAHGQIMRGQNAQRLIKGKDAHRAIFGGERIEFFTSSDPRKYGPRNHKAALAMGAEGFAALHALHTTGYVHADLKLANTMIDTSRMNPESADSIDNRPHLRVIDFGIAGKASDFSAIGSATYRAPELFRMEAAPNSPARDVWPMGQILVSILFGANPGNVFPFMNEYEDKKEASSLISFSCKPETERCQHFLQKFTEFNGSQQDPYSDRELQVLARLFARMFDFYPPNRPTAEQVLGVLQQLAYSEAREIMFSSPEEITDSVMRHCLGLDIAFIPFELPIFDPRLPNHVMYAEILNAYNKANPSAQTWQTWQIDFLQAYRASLLPPPSVASTNPSPISDFEQPNCGYINIEREYNPLILKYDPLPPAEPFKSLSPVRDPNPLLPEGDFDFLFSP